MFADELVMALTRDLPRGANHDRISRRPSNILFSPRTIICNTLKAASFQSEAEVIAAPKSDVLVVKLDRSITLPLQTHPLNPNREQWQTHHQTEKPSDRNDDAKLNDYQCPTSLFHLVRVYLIVLQRDGMKHESFATQPIAGRPAHIITFNSVTRYCIKDCLPGHRANRQNCYCNRTGSNSNATSKRNIKA